MDFIDNLFHVTSILKKHLTVEDITFLPSFKSQFICDEYQIPYTIDETNMKIIRFNLNKVHKDINFYLYNYLRLYSSKSSCKFQLIHSLKVILG